jgi:hypothetical protein
MLTPEHHTYLAGYLLSWLLESDRYLERICGLTLLEPFPQTWLDRTLELRLGDLPREGLFERKRAPGAFRRHVSGTKLHEQQVGHDGDGPRAFDPWRLLGDLMWSQARGALQCFHEQLDRPAPPLHSNHLPSRPLREIGHQDFGGFRPIVTPVCAQHDGAISAVPHAGLLGLGPGGPAAA